MNRFLTTLLTLAALAVAMPAGAAQCVAYTTSHADVDTRGTGNKYYVDTDTCQPRCLFSVWIYEETNGISGLQRKDRMVDDTCRGLIEPDRLVW